jgi:Polyketide cyclase / dehydrase and lipid transport
MTDVSISLPINASAARVWSVFGGFDNLPVWLNIIRRSRLGDGGRLRCLETATGAVIIERLLDFSEAERRYSYALIEGPDAVSGYVGTMSVHDDGDARSVATWPSRFKLNETGNAADFSLHYERIYRAGPGGLKTPVESGSGGA